MLGASYDAELLRWDIRLSYYGPSSRPSRFIVAKCSYWCSPARYDDRFDVVCSYGAGATGVVYACDVALSAFRNLPGLSSWWK